MPAISIILLDRLLLDSLNLQSLEFLIKDLTLKGSAHAGNNILQLTKSIVIDSWIFCHKWARKI